MFGGRGGGRGGVNSKVGGSTPSSRTMFLKKKVAKGKPSDGAQSSSDSSAPQQSPQGSPRSSRSSSLSPHSSPDRAQSPERKVEDNKFEGPEQELQDPVIAYYLFERESQRDGVTRLAFVDGSTVYVIDKERVLREGKF